MRYRIFLDTNVLISGIFFEGNESKILNMIELDLIISEDVVNELKKITKKKLKYLGGRTLEIALSEIDRALYDIEILSRERYLKKFAEAKGLMTHEKDIPILAAALYAKVDYLLTGDSHFFTDKVKAVIKVRTTKEFLEEIEKV
ncbi:MAG TPA: putative toxin-antitoxin system toxin component, PIN family [Candidatus Atribacteria bacterium]|nr:putative toxin-antitoxin system toxin component, PIN family [Candidatus Atribacteria bacterium]